MTNIPPQDTESQIAETARLNDLTRHGRDPHAKIVFTRTLVNTLQGDCATPEMAAARLIISQQQILHIIRNEPIEPDDDPHLERDFGAIVYEGERIYWKIDYYNKDLTGGSETKWDPSQTTRVMTVMLASDY